MQRIFFITMLLLIMVGFNFGNVLAEGLGGRISKLLLDAGGGGRIASDSGMTEGAWWSMPYIDAVNATDGDYSTYAHGSITGDGTGNNVECSVRWDMGVISDVSIITIKADITGTPHGNLLIRVSQDGLLWMDLGFQIGINSNPLQKERTIFCPYRIRYIQVVSRTSYSDASNMRIYELIVR